MKSITPPQIEAVAAWLARTKHGPARVRGGLLPLIQALRKRGGWLACTDFANALEHAMSGVDPHTAIELAIDEAHPERVLARRYATAKGPKK